MDLARTEDFWDYPGDDFYEHLEARTRDADALLLRLAGEAAAVLGQPILLWAEPDPRPAGLHDDFDASSIARWDRPEAILTMLTHHEDKELPIRVMLLLSPPQALKPG